MGTREENTPPTKASKPPSSNQEIPAPPRSYADWSSHMQAYYGSGATPPPFPPSAIASPVPNPYMWGGQYPLMAPYGTPIPYMYPPGGVYAHPNIAMTSNSMQTGSELEGKGPEGKNLPSAKKSNGASGSVVLVGGKATATARPVSDSGNDDASQSGSEDSADASDENANQQELSANKKGSFNQMLAEAASAQNTQSGVSAKPVGSVPATNLNIGMELWPATAGAANTGPNPSGASSAVVPSMVGCEGIMPEQWIQDERELKRQKRKQSNRESAKRSRLRKQAECEELQQRVDALNNDNSSLRDELQRLSEECEKLTSENNSIKEELTRLCETS